MNSDIRVLPLGVSVLIMALICTITRFIGTTVFLSCLGTMGLAWWDADSTYDTRLVDDWRKGASQGKKESDIGIATVG